MQKKSAKIYKYTAIFEPAEEGGYIVTVPMLPGCVTEGDTFEQAKKMAKDAIQAYITVLKEDGDEIPVEKEEKIETIITISAPSLV
ncbi:MAG: type II toxin-antitoxin system HicB family antitoxin [Candidatus Kuenenbacteria bacterium]